MDIRQFSSLSENGTDWTAAFRSACEALRDAGGGVLTVPAGDYPTGPIRLYSHTTLQLDSGAVLRFSQDPEAYPLIPLEFEGIPGPVRMPCLFAEDAEDIFVTGFGTLDGQGEPWWRLVREKTLDHPRPYLVCFSRCHHVVLENVTLTRSPCWTVHPLRCENIVIRGLNIRNPWDSPNTDGINPDGCRDVRILDCTIDVGDDCIAIKSGTEDTPDARPCERILISGCHFLHGHGGVVMGSEMSGGIHNVLVSNCIFYGTDRGIRLKTRRGRGGTVEGVRVSSLTMEKVMCPFVFNMYYFCGKGGKTDRVRDKSPLPVDETTPVLKDVTVTDVTVRACSACAGFFHGLPESPVQGVTLQNVTVEMDPDGKPAQPAMMDDCPEMQARGFYLRNARGVNVSGVRVLGVRGETLDMDDSVLD